MAEKKNPIEGLKRFEGKDVMAATIAVTGAGDGLSEAMDVGPTEYHQGDTVYTVMEHVVSKVTYEDMPKMDGALRRKHTFKTQHATVVDGQSVAAALTEHKRLVAIKREKDEEAKGVHVLPGTSVEETDPPKRPDDWDGQSE
jgi:hypothetical protein